jgi:broad specificity phosphatase PhoE
MNATRLRASMASERVEESEGRQPLGETTIYLVRHAHADWQPDDGRPLSASGRAAADVLAERLSSRPIAAIYSSPSRRSVDTVAPLAARLSMSVTLMPDLRERELPQVRVDDFEAQIRNAWERPDEAVLAGESNRQAQARALDVLRAVAGQHAGRHVCAATHGNLLALMLNGLNPVFGYDFWRRLTFPDAYRLDFDGATLSNVERVWQPVED